LEARILCQQLTAATSRLPTTGPIYLANMPAEWNDVPLFISDWALKGTLALQDRGRVIISLGNIIKSQREEQIETKTIDGHSFAMRLLSPNEFFRLEHMDILSGAQPITIGYSYSKGDIIILVTGLNKQGQANALKIDMGSSKNMSQVYMWNGEQLTPLVGP
jgi:hypothetical protein